MPGRRPIYPHLCALVLMSACSGGLQLDSTIDESSQGAVYLRRVLDHSFQAAHPITIESSVIVRVLNGILVRHGASADAVIPSLRRAFADREVGYLAPLISESLRRAESDQQVRFRVGDVEGLVYAYGRSLYVTLTRYRSGSDAGAAQSVAFIPDAAKRPDSYLDPGSTGNTVVINYELLAMLPAASLPPASGPSVGPTQQSTTGGQTDGLNRDSDIEALRKEMQEIKKQLAEQEAERARSSRTNPASQK